jgi:hypothetical protein
MPKLTEQAARRFADMTDQVEEALNAVHSIQRRVSETERQMRNKNPETQAEDIAVYQSELDRQYDRLRLAQHTHHDLSRVHTAVRSWMTQLGSLVEFEDIEEPYVTALVSGETFGEAVTRIRVDIEEMVAARSAIRRSVPPLFEFVEQVDAHVDALAARGRPSVRIEGDKLVFRHVVEGSAGEQVAAQLAWLDPERMKDRIHADLKAQREHDEAHGVMVLPARDRKEHLRGFDQQILAKEYIEEALLRLAEDQNTVIPRREKASPLAILGIRVRKREMAAA